MTRRIREEFKPSKPMNIFDLVNRVQEFGLKGAQVGVRDMPALGCDDLKTFREKIEGSG